MRDGRSVFLPGSGSGRSCDLRHDSGLGYSLTATTSQSDVAKKIRLRDEYSAPRLFPPEYVKIYLTLPALLPLGVPRASLGSPHRTV